MNKFKKALREVVFLKLALTGPSGAGKTNSALRLASGLAQGGRIAFLDTENRSASLYADQFNFEVMEIDPPFQDVKFIDGINEAVREGFPVVVIDSASHFWQGILEYKAALDARGGNSYINWDIAGTKFKAILDAILQSKIHLICCMRSKMDYILELNDKGKQQPRKVGLAPIMRDGVEYEFTTVFDIGADHTATTSKDRTGLFTDQKQIITEEHGQRILNWLRSAQTPQLTPIPGEATPLTPEPEVKKIPKDSGIVLIERLEALLEPYEPHASAFFLDKGWIKEDQTFRDIDPIKADKMLTNSGPLEAALIKRKEVQDTAPAVAIPF